MGHSAEDKVQWPCPQQDIRPRIWGWNSWNRYRVSPVCCDAAYMRAILFWKNCQIQQSKYIKMVLTSSNQRKLILNGLRDMMSHITRQSDQRRLWCWWSSHISTIWDLFTIHFSYSCLPSQAKFSLGCKMAAAAVDNMARCDHVQEKKETSFILTLSLKGKLSHHPSADFLSHLTDLNYIHATIWTNSCQGEWVHNPPLGLGLGRAWTTNTISFPQAASTLNLCFRSFAKENTSSFLQVPTPREGKDWVSKELMNFCV